MYCAAIEHSTRALVLAGRLARTPVGTTGACSPSSLLIRIRGFMACNCCYGSGHVAPMARLGALQSASRCAVPRAAADHATLPVPPVRPIASSVHLDHPDTSVSASRNRSWSIHSAEAPLSRGVSRPLALGQARRPQLASAKQLQPCRPRWAQRAETAREPTTSCLDGSPAC